MKNTEEHRKKLLDAGCSDKQAETIAGMYGQNREQELMHALKKHRCALMSDLHEQQRKVDRIDYLIREQLKGK